MSSNDVRKRSKEGREEAQDLGNSTSTQLGKAAGKGAGRALPSSLDSSAKMTRYLSIYSWAHVFWSSSKSRIFRISAVVCICYSSDVSWCLREAAKLEDILSAVVNESLTLYVGSGGMYTSVQLY